MVRSSGSLAYCHARGVFSGDIVNLDVTIFVLVNLDVPSNLDVANNSVLNLDVANNSVVKFRRTQQFSVKFRRSQSTNRCNSVYSDICCMRNAHRAPGIAIRLIRSAESLAFSCCREITSCRLATSRLRRSVGSAHEALTLTLTPNP